MADYGVNIAVAVKNSQAITKLSRDVKTLSGQIDNVNKNIEDYSNLVGKAVVNSTANFSKALQDAAENLNKVALNGGKATQAAREFLDAQLLSNQALEEQKRLVREVFLAGKPVQATPFGPQPFSSQKQLADEGRTRARLLAIEADKESKLRQERFQATSDFLNKLHDLEVGLGKKANSMEIDNIIKEFEIKERLEKAAFDNAIKRDKEEAKRFMEQLGVKKTAELRAIEEVDKARKRAAHEAITLVGQTSPIDGAVGIPGSPAALRAAERAKRLRSAQGSALIGGAFPLLFGQGIGASIGGGLGGFAGGMIGGEFGFGVSLIGTQIGSMFDELASKAVNLSAAMNGAGDATGALEALIGRVDTATKSRITNLQESGQTARAADAAFEELSDTIGETSARGIVQAGKDFESLGNAVMQASAAIGGFVLNLVQETFGLVSLDPTATSQEESLAFKRSRADTGVAVGIAELETLEVQAVLDKDIERTAEIRKRLAVQTRLVEETKVERELSDQIIDDDIRENKLLIIQEKYNRELLQIDQKRLTATEQRTEREEADADRKRREAESAALEAKRKQDEIRRGIDSQLKKSKALNIATLNLEKDKLAIQHGGIDLLSKQFQIEIQLSDARKEAINAAYESGALEAKSVEEQQLMLENKNTEIELETELLKLKKKNVEQQIGAYKLSRLQAEQALRMERMQAGFSAAQEIRATSPFQQGAKLFNPFFGESSQLQIEQTLRYSETLALLKQELNDVVAQQEILALAPRVHEGLEQQENKIRNQIAAFQEYEPAIDAAALAQARFNEAMAITVPVTDSLFDSLVSVVEGTKTAEEAFADFLRSIASMLFDAAKQMIATYIAIGIARTFAGMPVFGSGEAKVGEMANMGSIGMGGSGTVTNSFGHEFGTLGPNFGIRQRAIGGAVAMGRPYLVGERGPELFIPGAQGNIVPNNAMGSANVTVNVDASGSQAQGDSQRGKQLGAAIGAAVQAELIKQKRPGGLLAS